MVVRGWSGANFEADFIDACGADSVEGGHDGAVAGVLVCGDEDAEVGVGVVGGGEGVAEFVGAIGFLSRKAPPDLSTETSRKSLLASGVAVVAVGRFTLTLLMLTMERLTSMKEARRKNMMSMRGTISIRASADSARSLAPSLTGM
jgi:hypothetical protein